MGYIMFPILVLSFFIGINAIEAVQTKNATLPTQVIQANGDGLQFVAYRNAVAVYLQNNPAYIGTVSSASLAALGAQFSTTFLANSGNYISQVGTGAGRVITCYAKLSPGAVTAALNATSNDASFGIASGGSWTSYAQGANTTPQSLATAVPNGDVVSVVQIGI